MIRKAPSGHGYTLTIHRKDGPVQVHHATRESAEAQETAINLSKARAAGDKIPPKPKMK